MQTRNDTRLVERLLETIESDILPLTERGVAAGNKIFGAALLEKDSLDTYLAATNQEIESPLWHGEMALLKHYHEQSPRHRPPPDSLLFVTTHEPCSLCLSAITWSGFDNFYYFFSHSDSRDAFAIPHDLRILKEVFDVDPGGYRADNAYWRAVSIRDLIDTLPADAIDTARITAARIADRYDALSAAYQDGKAGNDIPLS